MLTAKHESDSKTTIVAQRQALDVRVPTVGNDGGEGEEALDLSQFACYGQGLGGKLVESFSTYNVAHMHVLKVKVTVQCADKERTGEVEVPLQVVPATAPAPAVTAPAAGPGGGSWGSEGGDAPPEVYMMDPPPAYSKEA